MIANKHYWQVTEDDFEAAVGSQEPLVDMLEDQVKTEAAQNAAQSVRAEGSLTLHWENYQDKKTLELQGSALSRDPVQLYHVGDEGLEPPTSSV